MEEKAPRKLIVEALMKHPEGLTLVSIAKATGLHRHTSTKYLHELMGAGLVYQRKVGPARLCYLKEKIDSKEKEKKVLEDLEKRRVGRKSQMKFIAVVLFLGVILASGAVIASNFLNETVDVSYTGQSALNLTTDNATRTFPQENTSVEIVLNETETNESTLNETPPAEIPLIEGTGPVLSISIEHPEKITRGETFAIKAKIENSGLSSAKNVVARWILPESFEIVSEKNNCEILEPNSSCNSEVLVHSSLSTELGINEIKVVVSYET